MFNNFVSDFTPNTSKIRGISVYVTDSLQCSQHSDLIENLWIEIRLQQRKSLLVGCIYRSPSLPKFDSTEDLCQLIKSVCDTKPHHILIVGNFNYSNINWKDYTASGVGSNDQMFIDTFQECVLHQDITEPTRYRQRVNPHTLDLVLTDEERMIDELRYLAALDKGDHVCITFKLNCCTSQKTTYHNVRKQPTLNFSKGEYERVRHLLNEINWVTLLGNLNTDESWKTFCTELNRIIQISIPKTIVKSKRKHPYITAKVLKLKYQKDKLWKKYSFSGDSLDYLRYTQKRNEIRNLTHSLRLNYMKATLLAA